MGEKLTISDVRRIISILDASPFDELELEVGDFKLALRRSSHSRSATAPANGESAPTRAAARIPASPRPAPASGDSEIKAPMFGIFYRAPKPGAPPFVEVGAKVEPDTVIGIIEVMKLMNSISAERAGEIVEIAAADGSTVELGQTLMRLRVS